MAGKAGEAKTAAAEEAAKNAAEEEAAKKAAEEAAAKKAAEDEEAAKVGKKEKTFTEAEVKAREKAAADKAAADALKKAEEEKDLSELEKAKKRIAELESAQRLTNTRDAAVEALAKAGARNPELLWKTIQTDVEFDDAGKPKNLEALVTGLKTDYADQFGEPKPTEGVDGGAGQGGKGGDTLTAEKLAKMTPAEINALPWEEVSKVMAAG